LAQRKKENEHRDRDNNRADADELRLVAHLMFQRRFPF
jgi:hypothetical protein